MASVPFVRIRDRAGTDVPAAVIRAPAGVHGPQVAIIAFYIGDVSVAVGEQDSVLTLRLLLEQFHKVSETDLSLFSEFFQNRFVQRILLQLVGGNGQVADVLFGLTEEMRLEVVPHVADVGRLLDLLVHRELGNALELDSRELREKLHDVDHYLGGSAEDLEGGILASHFLDQRVQLASSQVGRCKFVSRHGIIL
mgnify:FL=1